MFLSNINSLLEILADKNFNQEDAECEGCEGSEASTEEAYQFNENKGSNLRWESFM